MLIELVFKRSYVNRTYNVCKGEVMLQRSYVNRTYVKEKLCYREVMLNKIYVGDMLCYIVKLNLC